MFNQGPFNLERGHWERRQMLDFKSNLIAKIVKSWSRLLHYSNRNSLPKFWALTHCSGSFSYIFPKQYFNGVKGSSILLSMNSKCTSIFQRYSIPCLVINFPEISIQSISASVLFSTIAVNNRALDVWSLSSRLLLLSKLFTKSNYEFQSYFF